MASAKKIYWCAFTVCLVLFSAPLESKATQFPQEFVSFSKELGCTPRTDKPFLVGVLKGKKKSESGAFWCMKPGDAPQGEGSIAIYIRDQKLRKEYCPSIIPNQSLYDGVLRVLGPETNTQAPKDLSRFIEIGGSKTGSSKDKVVGYVLENVISKGTASALYYCHKKRWMVSYNE